jgi:hypothetical protein
MVARAKKKREAKITADAFLEAVLDAGGLEEDVLAALEVKSKELHAWMAKNADVVNAARDELEERNIDTTEADFGWLRGSTSSGLEVIDLEGDWAQYREFLLEQPKIEAREELESAMGRTADLVARLQAEKRAKKKPKGEPTPPEYWD